MGKPRTYYRDRLKELAKLHILWDHDVTTDLHQCEGSIKVGGVTLGAALTFEGAEYDEETKLLAEEHIVAQAWLAVQNIHQVSANILEDRHPEYGQDLRDVCEYVRSCGPSTHWPYDEAQRLLKAHDRSE